MVRTTRIYTALICCAVLSLGAPAFAGLLNDNASAFNDGNGPGTDGRWAGTAVYDNGAGFNGTVDYAVFNGLGFTTAFPTATYSPTAGELVYVYQVRNGGGSFAASFESVSADPADNIGSYELEVGDIPPFFSGFGVGTAQWAFQLPEIGPGENSYGLAFSSTNLPEFTGTSLTIDGGTPAVAIVPTPGDNAIPEPASLVLVCLGAALLLGLRRQR